MQKTHLVIIDPQVDFCDPTGSLFVSGADTDMQRLGTFIDRVRDKLTAIHITLDSHHLLDIAHPVFWKDKDGANLNPFTIVSNAEVENGTYYTTLPSWQKRAAAYVKSLEDNKRYPLCIWPPHCLIGSRGASVVDPVMDAVLRWEEAKRKPVNFVTKGSNPWTEHYSAVQADVPDPQDPSTQINTPFIQVIEDADEILVAGEASSHCLANTVRDIANNFASDSYVNKLTYLEDASSPVPTFEQFEKDFVDEMTAKGMKINKTTEWMI